MSAALQAYFESLAAAAEAMRGRDEITLIGFYAEESDFVRLNRGRVRQAGSVVQRVLHLDLVAGRRHVAGSMSVAGALDTDRERLAELMATLREQRAHVPEDPYLAYATEVHSTTERRAGKLPGTAEALAAIRSAAASLDLVGIWASGTQHFGFANALGQRNWHSVPSFHFDWSCHLQEDRAVKCAHAGDRWQPERLEQRMAGVREQLDVLARPPVSVPPGRYRAYLAPGALEEILHMLAWGGFGLKSHRTLQTPLLKMVQEGRRLHPAVTLSEDRAQGLAPGFTSEGFIKAERVPLIERGEYRGWLTDARSGAEFGMPVTSEHEFPEALDMTAGDLPAAEIPGRLGRGLYLNNLWYCNYSDRNDCRITGLTRFACFWVEDGRIAAPLGVMRFDESVYRMLGEKLLGLTRERELRVSPGTYGRRSTACMQLPGALVEDFTLTL